MDEQVRCLSSKHVPTVTVVLCLFRHIARIAREKMLLGFASDTKLLCQQFTDPLDCILTLS